MLDPTSMRAPSPLMMPETMTIFLPVPLTAARRAESVVTVVAGEAGGEQQEVRDERNSQNSQKVEKVEKVEKDALVPPAPPVVPLWEEDERSSEHALSLNAGRRTTRAQPVLSSEADELIGWRRASSSARKRGWARSRRAAHELEAALFSISRLPAGAGELPAGVGDAPTTWARDRVRERMRAESFMMRGRCRWRGRRGGGGGCSRREGSEDASRSAF